MFASIRNIFVNIMAAFIRNKEARHDFRSRNKKKNISNKIDEIYALIERFRDLQKERSYIFRVTPLDNLPPQGPESEVYLAIACISKNEAPYLREWIEYHKIVGVERFYFYDNESDDNTKEVLEPYIKDGTLVYHFLPNHPITGQRQQIEAYNDAIFKYRSRTKWMAIIDIDEFLVPVEKNSVTEFLADYDQYPAVVANWVCFDSNGHEKKPAAHGGLLTANYTRVRKNHENFFDTQFKSIVNPKKVVNYISEHHGLYYSNQDAVNENFDVVQGQFTKYHSASRIRINHYYTKSREEYSNKVMRNTKGSQSVYKFNESYLNFKENTIEDRVIQKYLPKLKASMEIMD